MTVPAIVRIPLCLVVAGLLTSCGLVASLPTASPFTTAAASTTPLSPSPSIEPTIEPPTSEPTSEPTRPPPATDTPPPRGVLTADETAVEGWLGSYCWQATCADAPGVPPKEQLPQVHGDGNELEFSLSDNATFVTWRATYASESNESPTTLGEGGEDFDPDARPSPSPELLSASTFDSPPRGDWVVFVQVFFDGGDLSYAWHVVVQ